MNWNYIKSELPNTQDVNRAICFLQCKLNFDYDTVIEAAEFINEIRLAELFVDLVLDEIQHSLDKE